VFNGICEIFSDMKSVLKKVDLPIICSHNGFVLMQAWRMSDVLLFFNKDKPKNRNEFLNLWFLVLTHIFAEIGLCYS